VLDDGVAFVAGDHADIEKTAVFGVAHGLEEVLVVVAVVLGRLDDCHLRPQKLRHQSRSQLVVTW
jgi:hypothetical protein